MDTFNSCYKTLMILKVIQKCLFVILSENIALFCVCNGDSVLAADLLTYIPATVCYYLCCSTSHTSHSIQVCFHWHR